MFNKEPKMYNGDTKALLKWMSTEKMLLTYFAEENQQLFINKFG